jgi:GalNAc-alpha-(1->4)-GalNAc-alpha-(1->3)-diNAcBac-PP-undecaprenol alpha-1,4-N-acetyl-D-galactosaminyltransferase
MVFVYLYIYLAMIDNITMNKIVFFLGGMSRGGGERVLSILANQYAEDGWDVSIVQLLSSAVEYPLHPNIKNIMMCRENKKRVFNICYWLSNIKKFVKKEKPDIVVSFFCRINILVLLGIRKKDRKKMRVVLSDRSDPRHDGRGKIASLLANVLYPKADKIIFQTSDAKKFFPMKVQKKGVVIANPVKILANLIDFDKRDKTIINVARLDKGKNHQLLIKAFSIVHQQYPDHQMMIYGEGPERSNLQALISNLKLDGSIHLPGNVLGVQQEVAKSSVFVLCSNYEGLSNALMEANALGIPCISTAVFGANDVIRDGYNGYVVPIEDVDALASKLIDVLSDDGKRREMAKNCLEVAETYKYEKTIKQYKDSIEKD